MATTTVSIRKKEGDLKIVAPGLAYMRIVMVNVFFVSKPDQNVQWFLVDAGMGKCAGKIKKEAENFFGLHTRPSCIVLTHGHFDHIGALPDLAEEWDVPVYAHRLELPYLTGRSSYPPPDPTVGGGVMPLFSPLFRRKPINLGARVRALEESIPFFPEWKIIHTPGHAPGHISLFREEDKTLVAGDAFVTVKQESAIAVLTQKQEVQGPPKYFTIDWYAAERSVKLLSDLEPEVAATGHGIPMKGAELRRQLNALSESFVEKAIPARGRYVSEPAKANEDGIVSIPKRVSNPIPKILASAALLGVAGVVLYKLLSKKKPSYRF